MHSQWPRFLVLLVLAVCVIHIAMQTQKCMFVVVDTGGKNDLFNIAIIILVALVALILCIGKYIFPAVC